MIEQHIERSFIGTLTGLKYEYRSDTTDRAALEKNFRDKFESLNRVRLTDISVVKHCLTTESRFKDSLTVQAGFNRPAVTEEFSVAQKERTCAN